MSERLSGPNPCNIYPRTKKAFIGRCHAVVLTERHAGDRHVCVNFLTEDDEYWFEGANGFSSSWMEEFVKLLQDANDWMKLYCLPDMHSGRQYGWLFKS